MLLRRDTGRLPHGAGHPSAHGDGDLRSAERRGPCARHRTRAKAVNFGIIYGQGEGGLAKVLGIPRADAARFIAAYFLRYQGVRRFP